MEFDENGSFYPRVNKDKCVNCGVCSAMCPVYGKMSGGFNLPQAYSGWNKDDEMRKISSSGGIFSEIAKIVIEKFGGVVYGAAYDENFNVKHIEVERIEDLELLRGSKYVQSQISESLYQSVEKMLKAGRYVLFSGTSCQTAAVSKLADKINKRENLLTVGVLCHGVPTQKAWQEYLKEQCGDKRALLSNVNMRDKTESWYWNYVSLYFKDGTNSKESYRKGIWGNSFFKNLFLRDSCYHCKFKTMVKQEDITLGDFWASVREERFKRYNDGLDLGVSVILVNSSQGEKIFSELSERLVLKNLNYEDILKVTFSLNNPVARHPKREIALSFLSKMPYSELVGDCLR